MPTESVETDVESLADVPVISSRLLTESQGIWSESIAPDACLERALEAERLSRAGNHRASIHSFQEALSIGTEDPHLLSAVYSQLGNAYFHEQDYLRALEFHRWDLALTRQMDDLPGEAKASGNLGNCLKMLNRHDEAIICCIRQLEICRRLNDKVLKARALYNLGNAYHTKGKKFTRILGAQEVGDFPLEAREAQEKALHCYEDYLKLVQELCDRPAEGRAYGNLGNTYYLLGNFQEAVDYHKKRLMIAKEFGDLRAQRRAYSNMGNAYIFLADFLSAAKCYKHALRLAQQIGEATLEAQACYSLGNTCALLREQPAAVVYHLRHLAVAWRLQDRLGEARAHWSLANAYAALGDFPRALRAALRHHNLSNQLGDETGQIAAKLMISKLRRLLSDDTSTSHHQPISVADSHPPISVADSHPPISVAGSHPPIRPLSQSYADEPAAALDAVELERELAVATIRASTLREPLDKQSALGGGVDIEELLSMDENHDFVLVVTTSANHEKTTEPSISAAKDSEKYRQYRSLLASNQAFSGRPEVTSASEFAVTPWDAEDQLFEMLARTQGQRMDEQRCDLQASERQTDSSNLNLSPQDEDFIDFLVGVQASRMNDQRADLPDFPGLLLTRHQGYGLPSLPRQLHLHPVEHHATVQPRQLGVTFEEVQRTRTTSDGLHETCSGLQNGAHSTDEPQRSENDTFFEMIMRRQQNTRINDQRANLPNKSENESLVSSVGRRDCEVMSRVRAPTVPNEDFFALIQRVQSNRLDEQRCNPPATNQMRPAEHEETLSTGERDESGLEVINRLLRVLSTPTSSMRRRGGEEKKH